MTRRLANGIAFSLGCLIGLCAEWAGAPAWIAFVLAGLTGIAVGLILADNFGEWQ